jgi:hypothetical protein
MLLSPFAAFLAALADRALRFLTGCPSSPPSFEGLLDELYFHWPLDAEELPGADARDLRAAA